MSLAKNSDFIGTEPIGKLLIKFATPAMLSSFINCIYNIVDRLYIGKGVGPEAQAGLSLTFPVMIILVAFGMMVGIGSSTVISLSLGQQKQEEAEKVLGQALAMFLVFVITIQAIALIFLDEILLKFGGTPEAIPYAHQYLSIILWGNVFQHISFGMSNIVRAEGNAYKSMAIIAVGAVMNIILDPIFIFKWNIHGHSFGFGLGIAGAAYATVLAMMISSTMTLVHFFFRQGVLKLHLKYIRIYPAQAKQVISIGMAAFLMQIVNCAIVILYNHSCKHFSSSSAQATLGIASFGITNTVMMCLLMPAFGIMQGIQPIIGYNQGAKLFSRVRHTFKLSMHLATMMNFIMAALMFTFARGIASCFTNDKDLIEIATYLMHAASLGFTFIAPGMLTSNYFQSIGRAGLALFFSMTRQVIFLLPVLLIMPRLLGFNGIWWAGPVSDTLGGMLALAMYFHELRKLSRMQDAPILAANSQTVQNAM